MSTEAPSRTRQGRSRRHGPRSFLIAVSIAALALLALAPLASADSLGPITFESPEYSLGSPNGQHGWSKTGPYDSEIASVSSFPAAASYGFGTQALRISNAKMSGSFGDQTISPQLSQPAGESLANTHYEASFEIGSSQATEQNGLTMSVSPDDGQGDRMSYLSFTEEADGIHVEFYDVKDPGPKWTTASFEGTEIATLSRGEAHSIRFVLDLVPGPANDVVRIFIDGALVHTGTSWEDYYRFDHEQAGNGNVVPNVSGLIFLTRGSGENPSVAGKGYLIDNVAFSSSAPTPSTVTVNDDTSGSGPAGSDCAHPDFSTIQSAVSAVAPGSTILVCGGEYTEQVDIPKSLRVIGDGSTDTVVRAPSGLETKFTTSGPNKPVIYVHDGATVSIRGLTVDGAGNGNSNYRLDGIAFFNADGSVRGSTITHVRNEPLDGVQGGVGLLAVNEDGEPRSLTVRGDTFSDFQKNATVFSGKGLSVDVSDNTIEGAGFTNLIAQNGVEIVEEAGGSVTGNTITGIGYSPNNWCAAGILLLDEAPGMEISGNTLEEVQCGIYSEGSSGTQIDGNRLLGSRYAISLFDNGATVDRNTIDARGAGFPDSEGIFAAQYGKEANFLVRAEQNTILGNTRAGLALGDFSADAFSARMIAHFNRIVGNGMGALDEAPGAIEAQDNWWGCNDGPGAAGCDSVEAGEEGPIDASPWLVLRLAAAPSKVYRSVGQSQLTADLTHNSDGAVAGSGFPDNTPIAFGGVLGSVDPGSDATVDGRASSLFTAGGTVGSGTATAQLDNQKVEVPIEVIEAPQGKDGHEGRDGHEGKEGHEGKQGKSGSNRTVALKRKMSISFPKPTAAVHGGKALVRVRCNGSVAQRCVGTLTLKVAGKAHKAVYTVAKGATATVRVSLGATSRQLEGGKALVARAVARTEQPSGRPFRTSRKLHLG